MKASHTVLVSLILATLLIVGAVTLSIWSFGQIEQAVDDQQKSEQAVNEAHDLLSALKDAETSSGFYPVSADS